LAITATLTNIVNPDPYYTLMIHDANDTHLDGHTFATTDTTATLTWTETSYGEKTYTKLLNGASIGTETITLTDPNVSTTPSYEFDISNGNLNATFTWDGTSDNWPVPYSTGQLTVNNQTARWQSQDYASGYGASPGQFNPGILGVANYGPYDIQQSEAHDSTYHIVFTNNIWSITHSGFTWKITLIDPNASTPPPTLANFIAMGNHQGELEYPGYTYQHKSTANSSYVYELTDGTGTATNIHDIEYNWSDKKWKDVDTHSIHNSFGLSASDTTTMAKTSPENPSVVYIFKSGLGHAPYLHGQLWAQFNNPYYEA